MNRIQTRRWSRLRRGGLASLAAVLGLGAATVSPAVAATQTLQSSILLGTPGVETHAGVPFTLPPPPFNQPPCAIFTAYTYNVAFPAANASTGTLTVGGATFNHFNLTVNSGANQWWEGPDGTFGASNNTCDETVSPPGDHIHSFSLVVAGINDSGAVLHCESLVGANNDYWRGSSTTPYDTDALQVNYDFPSVGCTAITPGVLPSSTTQTFHVNFDLVIATPVSVPPVFPDPIFGWGTACTGPIAPAACVNEGTITFS